MARNGEISSVAMGIKSIAASLSRMSGGFSVWRRLELSSVFKLFESCSRKAWNIAYYSGKLKL
jgi:hypothetical protein